MIELDRNLKEAIGESYKYIEIDDSQTDMYIDILKLPHKYLLDFELGREPATHIWQRTVNRSGLLFIIYYKIDAELSGGYDANTFAIDRLHMDISKIIMQKG